MENILDCVTKYDNLPQDSYQFSILIPTWNNLAYLQCCINSIKKHGAVPVQIIVFVNEGKDGTLEWLETQKDIDYIHATKNVGICYALNLCRSLVKSEYIVYINDDMYVLPNWDTALKAEIEQVDGKSFMFSATMVEPHDTGNPCVVVKNFGDNLDNFDEEGLVSQYSAIEKGDWNGSTWPPNLVHRDLWDMVGGLSIEFSPGMYSDPDFTRKLHEAGVTHLKGVGKSLVYHFGSKSTKKIGKSKGRDLYLLKWGITSSVFGKKVLAMGTPYTPNRKGKITRTDRRLGKLKILKWLAKSGR